MISFINSMPKSRAFALSFGASVATTTFFYSWLMSTAPSLKTMKPDWMAASRDCARFQKQDPIAIN